MIGTASTVPKAILSACQNHRLSVQAVYLAVLGIFLLLASCTQQVATATCWRTAANGGNGSCGGTQRRSRSGSSWTARNCCPCRRRPMQHANNG
jgi:hypothetical protein